MSGSIVWDDAPKSTGIVWDDGPVQSPTRFQKRTAPAGGESLMPDLNTPAAMLAGAARGVYGNLAPYFQAATLPALIGGMVEGKGPTQVAQDIRQNNEALAESNPAANIAGRVGGALGSGVLASPALGYTAPAAAGMLPKAGALGSYLGRNALFGLMSGATEGDTLGERATNAGIGAGVGTGAAVAAPAIGKALQAIPNAASMAYTGARNLFTTRGHEGMAGNVLREVAGETLPAARTAPIPGLELRSAQAFPLPGLAGLEQSMERRINAAAPSTLDMVQGGRTPRQSMALSEALMPGSAGKSPGGLLQAAAERGARSVQSADEAITKAERGLWGAIGDVRINATPLADNLEAAFARLPENQRAVATQAEAYIRRVRALGEGATITGKESINGVRSDLLEAARAARGAGNTDAAKAYNALAAEMADYIGKAPEIAGRAANPGRPVVGRHSGQPFVDANGNPLVEGATPAIPPNPAALSNWNKARQFTRETNTATGYPEFDRLLRPNAQGNVTADPARAYGAFFPGKSPEGVRRLENMGQYGGGAEISDAARQYFRASALNAGRRSGSDVAGNPQIQPGQIQAFLEDRLPALSGTRTFSDPEATQLGKVAEAAGLLNAPLSAGRTVGSNTFNKFENNELLRGALGQAGAPLITGLMGAAAADYSTPLPSVAALPLGFAAGAIAGSKGVAPIMAQGRLGSMLTGSAQRGIEQALIKALESPNELVRLHAVRALQSRNLGDPGWASGLMDFIGRGAAPAAAHVGAN